MTFVDELLADEALGALRVQRETVRDLTERCHQAVISPKDPGGLAPALRLALATRIATQTGDAATAAVFRGKIAPSDAVSLAIADGGTIEGDQRVAAIVARAEQLSLAPKDATAADIETLTRAGVATRDIVALAELVAFLSYELRVMAGLRLLSETAR